MKRIGLIGLVIAASLAVSAMSATTASATTCRRVAAGEPSKFASWTVLAGCTGSATQSGWVLTTGTGVTVGGGVCYRVAANEPSKYLNNNCSTPGGTTGGYIIIDPGNFHAGEYPAKAQGKGGEQTFEAGGATITCTELKLASSGAVKEDSSQAKFAPSYVNCKSSKPIEGGVKINPEGCVYNLHREDGNPEGTVSVECSAEKTISIEGAFGCVIKVGPSSNQNLGKWVGENAETKPKKVKSKDELTSITTTVNASCEISGIKSTKEGKYKGSSELEAENSKGGQIGLEITY